MLQWIKKVSLICAFLVFIIVLLSGIDFEDILDEANAIAALSKALCSAIGMWLVSMIICDIIFKGITNDISNKDLDISEGGLIQRISEVKTEPLVKDGKIHAPVPDKEDHKKSKKKKKI